MPLPLSDDDTQSANAVTRDVYRLLQQLMAAIEAELESNPSSDRRTCSGSQAAAYTRNDHHHSKVQLKECKEKQSRQLRFKHAAFHTNKQSLQAKSANSNVAGCLHSFFFPFGHINTIKRLLERHYNIRNDYKLYRHKGRNSASGCSPGVIGLLVENVIPRDEVNSERKSDQEERGEFEAGYHGRVRFTVRILLACELVE